MSRFILLVTLIIVVFLASLCLAGIPKLINYQGMLTQSDGTTPVTNGNYPILFGIYNTSSGGSALWSHTYNVSVTRGLFNVILGDSGAPISLPFNVDYWLELKVGADPPLSPRIKLTSVAYAYRASVADSAVASPPPSTGGGWTDDGTNVRLTTSTDKVGIGTSSPETYSKLHIVVPRTQSFDRVTIECPRDSNGFGIELKQPGGYWRLGQNVGNGWNDYFTITNNISPYYRLTILSDGRVGIGTVDPAYKLDVRGDRIQLKEDATGDWISMRTDGTALDLSFGGANLYVQSSTAGEHILLNPTTNSYVGIGTTTPGTKLDISSSSGTALRAVNTSASSWGIDARAKEAGGYFLDTDDSAYAKCGYGGYGVQAQGNSAGGCFKDKNGSGEAWVGTDHPGWECGIDAYGNAWGGGFTDKDDGGWAWVAYYSYKIWGSGSASFVQNHPYNKNQVIVYASPEGDEVATYTRGTARLINGEARVIIGETFRFVTNPDIGLTAHITPRGDCKGLYVASLTTSEMVVKELQGGTSDVSFDYLVYGLRIGFEEASVVQEKIREAYIPSMANHRERYSKYPELRRFNALERFREMNAQIGKPFDLSGSHALRDAIHEFDPAIDKLPEPGKH